jgi:hypothetical protein
MMHKLLFIPLFLCFLIQNCDIILGCESKCKNKTRDCFLQNQLFNTTTTRTITAGSSSGSTGSSFTKTEVEPNNTFLQNFNNVDSALSVSFPNKQFLNATISSASDIDIFDISSGSDYLKSVTQENSLDTVNCIVYEKLNSFTKDEFFSPKLATNSSNPDSSYINKGKLNPTFTMSGLGQAYFVCSGTAGTNYTLRAENVDSGISGNSPASATSFFTNYTLLSSLTTCPNATKDCEKKCSKN